MANLENRICQNCKQGFIIEPEDFSFYEKMKAPPPTFCPECRFVRRLLMRNERALFKRKCDMCGAEKIVVYRPGAPFKVYCYACWWGDGWDASAYAKEYDFSRPFFEQFNELFHAVPRLGIIQQGFNAGSEYANRVSDLKNCYLIFASANNENCWYGASFWNSRDSLDCYNARKCERCYEGIDLFNCNNVRYSRECNSCSNSAFLSNCRNCESCFGCVNLRNKNYCMFNVQYTREEYIEKMKEFDLGDRAVVGRCFEKLKDLEIHALVPSMVEHHTTNVSGNWIEGCKNAFDAYNCEAVEDGKYLLGIMEAKDVMDYTYWGKSCERVYQSSSIGRQCSDIICCNESWDALVRAEYSMNCHNSSDVFGCIGLRKKQFCILNKQYSKEEYETLLPRVREHMTKMPFIDGMGRRYSYGEFFPPEISAYPYNETIAQEYFPIDRARAEAQGYAWQDSEERHYIISMQSADIPASIRDVHEGIVNEIIGCAHGGKCTDQCITAFRIPAYELSVYRGMNIPIPSLCPNCRHYERLKKRLPMKLVKRPCECGGLRSKRGGYKNITAHFHREEECPNLFETSYVPERPETVYCLDCYRAEVT